MSVHDGLKYNLRLDIFLMAFFLLRNILNICGILSFYLDFMFFSSPINNAIGILMGISLIGRLLLNYNHFLNINFSNPGEGKTF